jgi:hypothetical protein
VSIADNGIVKFFEDVGQNPLGPAGAIYDSIFGTGSSKTIGENLPVVGKVVQATDSIQTAISKKTTKTTKKKVKSGKKKTNKKAASSRVRRTSKKRASSSLKKKRKSKSKSKKK